MLPEVLGLVGVLAILTLVGSGPALWLASGGNARASHALGLAPVMGYAIIGVTAFPLARFVAPVGVWAWPLTVALLAASGGLAVLHLRRGGWRGVREDGWLLAGGALLVLAGGAVLARPVLQSGMQYAVYRSNPSDAYLYTSLAETLHSVRWQTLLEGAALNQSNWAGLQALADASPTAVFTARFISYPLAVNKMALTAWAAAVAGAPVYRFYYLSHVLAFAVTLPAVSFLGRQLRLPGLMRVAVAGAVGVGYWAHFLLEADAGYEISALPLMALAVAGWALLEQAPERLWSGGRVILALAVAGLIMFYFPVVAVLGVAGALYYGLGPVQRTVTGRALAAHLVTAGLVLGLLAATGQLDYAARNVLNLVGRADAERAFEPLVLNALRRDGLGGLWGFSAPLLVNALPGRLRWPVEQGFDVIGVLLAGAWLIGAAGTLHRSAPRPERVVSAAFWGGAVFAAGLLVLRDNERTAGKALTYVYPYLFLGAAAAVHHLGSVLAPRAQRVARLVVPAALACSAALGLVWPDRSLLPRQQPPAPKLWAYDLGPIEDYLAAHPPRQLVVSVPRDEQGPYPDNWAFAYYAMLAFRQPGTYFLSGIVIDNAPTTRNLWLQAPAGAPDYLVVLKQADFAGPAGLGTPVAETADLVLYQVTQPQAPEWKAEEQRLQAIENTKGQLAP